MEEQAVSGRLILKQTFEKKKTEMMAWIVFVWFRIRTGGRLVYTWQ